MPLTPKAAQVVDRVSTTSVGKLQVVDSPSVYQTVKTPGTVQTLEDGALRAGGAPNIYSREHIGLLVLFFGAGLIYSVIYQLVYPLLNNYLRMSGVVTASARVLLSLPYSLRVFFGILSDCFPICGYRRRPYMVVGYALCAVCCFAIAVLPVGDPYYPDPSLAFVDPTTLSQEVLDTFNRDAPASGTKFVILLACASLGMVVARSASGGTLVELSQREPEKIRGTLQTMVWVARDIGGMFASLLVGFGLNSKDFGGSFDSDMGVNGLMWICAVVAMVCAVSAWFNISEEKVSRLSVRTEVGKLFELMQMKVVYYVLIFQFFKNMFAYTSVTAAYPIQRTWVKVEPVNSSIASILSKGVSAVTLFLVTKYGLNWNWRYIIVVCQIGVILLDTIPTFLTIYDVFRSQWFWLGLPLVEEIPATVGYIVSTFCMVEIIENGNEAAFYGLVTSVSSLASPFSTVITKNKDANFDIGFEALQKDNSYVHTQVTYAYLCMYAMQLCSLVFVVFLPTQKAHTQELKRTGGKSFVIGVATVVFLVFVLVWSFMTNFMSIFPSTSCLVIAGGSGC